MSQLVQPHGSDTLNILLLDGAEREQALAAARDLPASPSVPGNAGT